ncbi:hypothetical protein EI94DRAFT_707770 [Lactarius quietus]|nr:hypothetical protein EI94DRAFT_707770 [Lactarius quietus]
MAPSHEFGLLVRHIGKLLRFHARPFRSFSPYFPPHSPFPVLLPRLPCPPLNAPPSARLPLTRILLVLSPHPPWSFRFPSLSPWPTFSLDESHASTATLARLTRMSRAATLCYWNKALDPAVSDRRTLQSVEACKCNGLKNGQRSPVNSACGMELRHEGVRGYASGTSAFSSQVRSDSGVTAAQSTSVYGHC